MLINESTIFDEFSTELTVTTRLNGGDITLEREHVPWLGRDLIRVDLPGNTIYLDADEARDLAQQLNNLALFIDEEGTK